MKNKAISLVLLLSMLLLSQSCGEAATDGGDATVSDETTSQAPETDYLETLGEADFEGAEFVILAHEAEAFPNLGSGELTGDPVNDALYKREQDIAELYNVTIVHDGPSDRGVIKNNLQNSVLARDEAYQLVMTSMADGINTLMPNGILYNLNSLPSLDLSREWWNQNLRRNLNFSGKVYTATGPICRVYYNTPIVTAFNTQLCENYGFENLYDVVESGKWTIDKFGELMKVGTEDLNGDGIYDDTDRYALLLDDEDGKALFVSAGGKLTEIAEDGSYYLDLASEKNLSLLDRLVGIFGDRSTSYHVPTLDATTEKMFMESRSTFVIISIGNIISHFRDMQADYGIIPMPKADESQEDYITYGNPWFASGVAVPANCSTPEMTGLVMEALAYISYRDLVPAIYDVTLQEKLTRDEKSKTMLDLIYRDIYFDLNSIYNFGDSANKLRLAAVGSTTTSYATTWASIESAAKSALAEIVEAEAIAGE